MNPFMRYDFVMAATVGEKEVVVEKKDEWRTQVIHASILSFTASAGSVIELPARRASGVLALVWHALVCKLSIEFPPNNCIETCNIMH